MLFQSANFLKEISGEASRLPQNDTRFTGYLTKKIEMFLRLTMGLLLPLLMNQTNLYNWDNIIYND